MIADQDRLIGTVDALYREIERLKTEEKRLLRALQEAQARVAERDKKVDDLLAREATLSEKLDDAEMALDDLYVAHADGEFEWVRGNPACRCGHPEQVPVLPVRKPLSCAGVLKRGEGREL